MQGTKSKYKDKKKKEEKRQKKEEKRQKYKILKAYWCKENWKY